MDENAIKPEMRLWALELLVCNLYAIMAVSSPGLMKRTFDQMIAGARVRGFEGYDPAMSDLLSAELESALARMMDMANSQMPAHLRGRE
jgi:hypothetical protein